MPTLSLNVKCSSRAATSHKHHFLPLPADAERQGPGRAEQAKSIRAKLELCLRGIVRLWLEMDTKFRVPVRPRNEILEIWLEMSLEIPV